MYHSKISLSLFILLIRNAEGASCDLGFSKRQSSLIRAHCKYPTTLDSLNSRHISSASVHLSGGGNSSISFKGVKESNELEIPSRYTDSDAFPGEEENNAKAMTHEEQNESCNHEQDSQSNEIVRGGDTGGMVVMKQSQSTSKVSVTGEATIVQKKKSKTKGKSDRSHLKIAKKLKVRFQMCVKFSSFIKLLNIM